jgi:hypothetical protein
MYIIYKINYDIKNKIEEKLPIGTFEKEVESISTNLTDSENKLTEFSTTTKKNLLNLQNMDKTLNTGITNLQDRDKTLNSVITNLQNMDKNLITGIKTLNTDITNLQNTDETLNTSITAMQGNYKKLTDFDTKLQTSVIGLTKDVTTLKTNASSFPMKDFATVASSTLILGPTANIKQINVNKPLNLSSNPLNMSDWKISSDNSKICFTKGDQKILCLNNSETPLELYNNNVLIDSSANKSAPELTQTITEDIATKKVTDVISTNDISALQELATYAPTLISMAKSNNVITK